MENFANMIYFCLVSLSSQKTFSWHSSPYQTSKGLLDVLREEQRIVFRLLGYGIAYQLWNQYS